MPKRAASPSNTEHEPPRKKFKSSRSQTQMSTPAATESRLKILLEVEKRKVTNMKRQLEDMSTSKGEALSEVGRLKSKLKSQETQWRSKMETLSEEMKYLSSRNETLSKENLENSELLRHKEEIFESQIRQVEEKNAKMCEEITQCKATLNEKNRENADLVKYKKLAISRQKVVDGLNEEILRMSETRSSSPTEDEFANQLRRAKQTIQELQTELKSQRENTSLMAAAEIESKKASWEFETRRMQSEIHELRQRLKTHAATCEDLESSRHEIDALKAKNDELLRSQVQLKPIQEEFDTWMAVICDVFPNCSSAMSLRKHFQEYQEKLIGMEKRQVDESTAMHGLSESIVRKDEEIERLNSTIRSLRGDLQAEQEHSIEIESQAIQSHEQYQAYKSLVEDPTFRSTVDGDKEHVSKDEFLVVQKDLEDTQRLLETMKQEKKQLKKESRRLNKRLESLEVENAALHARVGKGEFNPLTTKVLHFGDNPLELAVKNRQKRQQERVSELEGEVSVLKQRLRAVKDAQGDGESGVRISVNIELQEKIEGMKHQIELLHRELEGKQKDLDSTNKINSRMRDIFSQKVDQYRNRIKDMLGWEVFMLDNNHTFKLRQMWMTQEEDEIRLQIDNLGHLNLSDTPFVRRCVKRELLKDLQTQRSLPLFLARLTQQLYSSSRS